MMVRCSQCLYFYLFTLVGYSLGSPEYWAERSQILADESHESLGGKLKFNRGERAVNDILMTAKAQEIRAGFYDPSNFLPSRNFMAVIEDIKESSTFQMIRKMPKGALLHAHDTALTSVEFVYSNITFRDHLHICRPGAPGEILGFRFLRSPDADGTCKSQYGWENLADLRADPNKADEINAMVKNSLTMVVPNPEKQYPNVDEAWTAFMNVFDITEPLLTYYPVFEDYYYQGLTELRDDNVFYLELRSILPNLYDLDGKVYGPIDVARLYKHTTDRFVKDNPDFIGAKLIFAPVRQCTTSTLDEYLRIAEELKKELPDFVAGFDLVGQEDKGKPLIEFADKLKAVSPDIPLFLHAGETNWYGASTDENLIDAVLLNATRIGHGYAILKHPKILDIVKERGIAIEVNPISNQVLRLVDDLRNHPASYLFSRDFPVIVSADDPGLWGATGLSYDFYEAFLGIMSRSADIRALKQLALNSIKFSAMSKDEKARALCIWNEKWAAFINDSVQDHNVLFM
ncbi:adenosine deaminase 2 [Athalia rosae]|uniref:adenosine deaminase 2 n=1 Tax=Athalia rosae TaxID=37344 RepID=UPI0020340890|nr:adenosine deaminase 2 [Athalia rosae]